MSRELIFRQWDKEYKEFREFDLNKNPLQWLDCMNSLALPDQLAKECIWDQFTGLRDCNGKMIFENDKVVIKKDYDDVFTVVWRNDYSCFFIEKKEECSYAISTWWENDYEVIGNVHEGVGE